MYIVSSAVYISTSVPKSGQVQLVSFLFRDVVRGVSRGFRKSLSDKSFKIFLFTCLVAIAIYTLMLITV